jgi:hypothetical protein
MGKRRISCVHTEELEEVLTKLKAARFKTHIIGPVDERCTVVYYRGRIPKNLLALYGKYEVSQMTPIGEVTPEMALTLDEHATLGEAFGYPRRQIEWFLKEMKECT